MEDREFYAELDRKLQEVLGDGGTAEKFRIVGVVNYKLFDANGNVKQSGQHHNLVNSVGDMYLAQLVANSVVGNPASMWAELGVNTTAPVKAGTGLGTLLSTSSVVPSAGYPVRVTSFSGTGEWTQWRFSWAAGVATCGSIGEVGMRTQAGSFIAHALVAPNVNKASGDTLQIDWSFKFLGA